MIKLTHTSVMNLENANAGRAKSAQQLGPYGQRLR